MKEKRLHDNNVRVAKIGKENICKPTIGFEYLHDNRVKVINFATIKNMYFRHKNIHKQI